MCSLARLSSARYFLLRACARIHLRALVDFRVATQKLGAVYCALFLERGSFIRVRGRVERATMKSEHKRGFFSPKGRTLPEAQTPLSVSENPLSGGFSSPCRPLRRFPLGESKTMPSALAALRMASQNPVRLSPAPFSGCGFQSSRLLRCLCARQGKTRVKPRAFDLRAKV